MPAKRKPGLVGGAIRAAAFLLVFLFLFNCTSRILRGNHAAAIEAFYREPAGSLDVLLMGSSRMLNGIAPMQLWEEQGIVSHNFAQNGQVLPVTYYALQEALRYQKPKLVVLDVYKVIQDSLIDSKGSLHASLDNMTFGLPKLRAVFDLLPAEDRPEFLLDIIVYHTRWKELEQQDYLPPDTTEKGARTLFSVAAPYEGWSIIPENETAPPAEVEIRYLEKIVDLCRKEGVDLLLVSLPFSTPEEDELNRQAVINSMAGYAADWDVPFVNLMYRLDELEFDFSQDMADSYHVNWRGMEKVTRWLGSYLSEHYDLPDHRGEAAYQMWDTALAANHIWKEEQLAALEN